MNIFERILVATDLSDPSVWDLGFGRKIPIIGKIKFIQGIQP
jgi:hypothetical protein